MLQFKKISPTYCLSFFFLLCSLFSYSQNFQYLKYGGGNNTLDSSDREEVLDMATDSQRNTYVISRISKNGVTLSGISITAHELWSVSYDMVLVSYTCEGAYRWHKVFGGGEPDYLSGVEIDSQDNVYVVGSFGQCSNPGPSDPYYSVSRISDNNGVYFTANTTQNSCQRAFRAKFNAAGVLQWLHYIQPATTSALATSGFIRNLYMVNDVLHGIAVLTPGTYEAGAINNTNTSVPFLFYLLKWCTVILIFTNFI